MDPAPPGAAPLAARAALSLLAVALLTALGLARLRRVPRPHERTLSTHAGGAVTVARVFVGTRAVGHSVRCDGREVLARPGRTPPAVREGSLEGRPWVVAGDGERVLTLRPPTCEARIHPDTGPLRAVETDGDALRIEASARAFRWRP